MFLKIPLSFLILGCFLTFNHARQADHANHDEISLTTDSGKTFKNEFEKSYKLLAHNTQWSYKNFVSIIKSFFEDGFETMTSYAMDLFLRMELYVIADGSHFIFPLSEKYETEQQYKAVAVAVSKLVMNLRTIERADKVMKNATKTFVSNIPERIDFKDYQRNFEKLGRVILHEYFKTVDNQMETDEVLRDEYKKLVDKARETAKQDPKMREPLDNIGEKNPETKYFQIDEVQEFLEDKMTFRQAIANKFFLKQSVKHFSMIFSPTKHHRYLLARALIQKAITTDESEVNDIYFRALVKAAEVVMDEDSYVGVGDMLFQSLEQGLEEDQDFYEEIKVLMKEIEKTTVYNTSMLYVDFSIF